MHNDTNNGIVRSLIQGCTSLWIYLSSLNYEIFVIWVLISFIDIILGTKHAHRNGTYTSSKMAKGLDKKIEEAITLFALTLLERAIILSKIPIPIPVGSAFVLAYIYKDMSSILETLILGGHDIPQWIKKWFEVSKCKINDSDDFDYKKGD